MSGTRAEFSLAVMAYNLKRVFNMKGAAWMHQALRAEALRTFDRPNEKCPLSSTI